MHKHHYFVDVNTAKNQNFLKYRKQLGQRIQGLRKQRGLSQEDLASAIGLDRVYIGYIEQGIRSASLETLFAISSALGVSASNLFET